MLIKANLPCEECGSSDALAKYTNGTYCFSCKHSTLLQIKTLRDEPTLSVPTDDGWVPLCTKSYPAAYRFLQTCYINQSLITKYSLMWCTASNRLVLPFFYKGKLSAAQLRSLDVRPLRKYIHKGPPGLWNSHIAPGEYVVVVEDILSAIRINEYLPAVALCGTKTDNTTKETLTKLAKTIILWLDSDIPGQVACNKLRRSLQLTNEVRVIRTALDPKCYKPKDLESYLLAAQLGK